MFIGSVVYTWLPEMGNSRCASQYCWMRIECNRLIVCTHIWDR
jgi:hypothetical protein